MACAVQLSISGHVSRELTEHLVHAKRAHLSSLYDGDMDTETAAYKIICYLAKYLILIDLFRDAQINPVLLR